ncbi:MAG TPA: hypothetical protein VIQ23_09475, partial [Hanamia sp.]
LLVLIILPALVQAQGDPGCDPFGYDANGNPCPIDGGLSALLAIGVGYGIKKYKESKKISSLPREGSDE